MIAYLGLDLFVISLNKIKHCFSFFERKKMLKFTTDGSFIFLCKPMLMNLSPHDFHAEFTQYSTQAVVARFERNVARFKTRPDLYFFDSTRSQ